MKALVPVLYVAWVFGASGKGGLSYADRGERSRICL